MDERQIMEKTLTFTLSETTRYTQSAGDTASWHLVIEVPAGTYRARCSKIGSASRVPFEEAYWVVVTMPGTVVGGWYPCHKDTDGGNGAKSQYGKAHDYQFQTYGDVLRREFEQGTQSEKWTYE
jgi:hypothetical protein